ncbi:MAG: hypothetical protein HP494_11390 [Nitrospira sp.]|nr:hypothetical protein [Nitrospira sp.]
MPFMSRVLVPLMVLLCVNVAHAALKQKTGDATLLIQINHGGEQGTAMDAWTAKLSGEAIHDVLDHVLTFPC